MTIPEAPVWEARRAIAPRGTPPPDPLCDGIRHRCAEVLGDRLQALSVLPTDYGFRFTVCVVVDGLMLDTDGSAIAAFWSADDFADAACADLIKQIDGAGH